MTYCKVFAVIHFERKLSIHDKFAHFGRMSRMFKIHTTPDMLHRADRKYSIHQDLFQTL